MTGRPIDQQRRTELLDAVVEYALDQGFAGLSWRPVAKAIGVSPTSLVHRFGTKEQMLQAIQARLRERILAVTNEATGSRPTLAAAARAVWERASHPSHETEFRLFFAVYGEALQAPAAYADFLDHVVTDWMGSLLETHVDEADPGTAVRNATLVIATVRGLLLDLLATGDRARVQDSADSFLRALE